MALRLGKKVAKWAVILTSIDYIALILNSIFSLVIIAYLQPENYAVFSISSATYIVLTAILQSFFATPFIRAISQKIGKKEYNDLSQILGFSLLFVIIASITIMAFYLGITPFVATFILGFPEVTTYMEILGINIVTLLLVEMFRGILLSFKSYLKLALFRIAESLTYILGIYFSVLIFDWTVLGIVIGMDIYTSTLCFIAFLLVASEIRKSDNIKIKITFNKSLFMEAFGLGKYFMVGRSFNYIFQRLDIFVVTILVHNKLLIGYYSFAKSLIYRSRILFTKIGGLLYPIFSEEEAKAHFKVMNKLLKAISLIAVILVFPISLFAALFSNELILILSLFLAEIYAYIDAAPVLGVFSLILVTYALNSVTSAYFNGIGEADKQIKANTILLLSSVVLFPVMTAYYSIIGTAVAYVISSYLKTLYWVYAMHKKIGINVRKYILATVSTLVAVIFSKGIYLEVNSILMSLGIGEKEIALFIIPLFLFFSIVTYVMFVKFNIIREYEMNILEKTFGSNKVARKLISIAKKIGRYNNS